MFVPIIETFGVTFTEVSLLSGYGLCTVAAVAIFVSAHCRKFGKRPSMVASMTVTLAGSLWGGFAKSYGALLGARVLQNLGVAMFESVTFAIVGDLYYVHQRGSRMSLYVLAQSGIANIPSLVAGTITQDLSWRWVFYLLSLFMGIGWVLAILFGWETVYNRNEIYNVDTSSQDVGHLHMRLA